jgi:hypothetical protein
MLRRTVWSWKRKFGQWRLPLIGVFGVMGGLLAGWLIVTPDWQRDDQLFRLRWNVGQITAGIVGEPRPYRAFADCDAAKSSGYANILQGEPSYRPALDADGDGVACEPYPG